MYTVFIVDDEPGTRSGLRDLFDWSALYITVAGDADDGATALPQVLRLKPDILLTDVRMPLMTGIELASRAREALPSLKIIFLSGYGDVDYFRAAFRVGAYDYLLKPLEFPDLESCLLRAVRQLDREKHSREFLLGLDAAGAAGAPGAAARLLRALVEERLQPGDVGDAFSAPAGQKLCLCALLPDEADAGERYPSGEDRLKMERGLLAIMEEELAGPGGAVAMDPLDERRFLAVAAAAAAGGPDERFHRVVRRLYEQLGIRAALAFSPPFTDAGGVRTAYAAAAGLLRRTVYQSAETFLLPGSDSAIAGENPVPADLPHREELRCLLKAGTSDELGRWIEGYFARLCLTRCTDAAFYRRKACGLIYAASSVLGESMAGSGEFELSQETALGRLFKAESANMMRRLVNVYCQDVCAILRLKNDAGSKKAVQNAIRIIEENYRENLTITSLSQQVYLTPSYLCMLFHQETGMTINSYLTSVRMQKAKELLSDPRNKLYDISYCVGYMNPSYFSRQFKKYAGCLPSDYRNQSVQKP